MFSCHVYIPFTLTWYEYCIQRYGPSRSIFVSNSREKVKTPLFSLRGVCGTLKIYLTRLHNPHYPDTKYTHTHTHSHKYDMQMTGGWQCLARHLRSSGWELSAFNDCVALSTLAHFSIFPFVPYRPQLSLRGALNLSIDDRNLWSCDMPGGRGLRTDDCVQ